MPEIRPIFLKARTVPVAYVKELDKQLDELVKEGFLEKTDNCEFGTL